MKKTLFFLLVLAIAMPVSVFSQKENSTIGGEKIEWSKFSSTIKIENSSIVKDLRVYPYEISGKDLYEGSLWGTILPDKIIFSSNVKSNVALFWFVTRTSTILEARESTKGGLKAILEMLQKNEKSGILLLEVEFTDPALGRNIRKIIQLDLKTASSNNTNGVQNLFEVQIDNEVLGVKTVNMTVQSPIGFMFSLENKDLGINFVVEPSDQGNVSSFVSQVPSDGVYKFNCKISLPNGISSTKTIEAFVKNGKIILDNTSFNPLSFADGKTDFSGKTTLVKMVNTRSSSILIFIPSEYIVKESFSGFFGFSKFSREMEKNVVADANANGKSWKAYVIPPGGSVKIMMPVCSANIFIHDYRSEQTEILNIGLISKSFQVIALGYGKRWYHVR